MSRKRKVVSFLAVSTMIPIAWNQSRFAPEEQVIKQWKAKMQCSRAAVKMDQSAPERQSKLNKVFAFLP